jgi:hypothetical protein
MTAKLQQLIRQGPNPDRGLTTLVLANYGEVKQARQLLWPWSRIAEALDLPIARARALSAAYRGVERRLKADKVRVGKSAAYPSPMKPVAPASVMPPLPPSPGQRPTVVPDDHMSELEKIRAKFDK